MRGLHSEFLGGAAGGGKLEFASQEVFWIGHTIGPSKTDQVATKSPRRLFDLPMQEVGNVRLGAINAACDFDLSQPAAHKASHIGAPAIGDNSVFSEACCAYAGISEGNTTEPLMSEPLGANPLAVIDERTFGLFAAMLAFKGCESQHLGIDRLAVMNDSGFRVFGSPDLDKPIIEQANINAAHSDGLSRGLSGPVEHIQNIRFGSEKPARLDLELHLPHRRRVLTPEAHGSGGYPKQLRKLSDGGRVVDGFGGSHCRTEFSTLRTRTQVH